MRLRSDWLKRSSVRTSETFDWLWWAGPQGSFAHRRTGHQEGDQSQSVSTGYHLNITRGYNEPLEALHQILFCLQADFDHIGNLL